MACGDLVKFQVEVGEDNKINKAVFKAFGCGSVIASSAYATEILQGKTLEDAYDISNRGNFLIYYVTLVLGFRFWSELFSFSAIIIKLFSNYSTFSKKIIV